MANLPDQIARAYANLKSLEETLRKGSVPDHQVDQYHRALDALGAAGFDVAEWRIPQHALHAIEHSGSPTRYAAESLVRSQLVAVLRYFEIVAGPEPRQIGFHGPKKESDE